MNGTIIFLKNNNNKLEKIYLTNLRIKNPLKKRRLFSFTQLIYASLFSPKFKKDRKKTHNLWAHRSTLWNKVARQWLNRRTSEN